jgi:hypothetical protein
MLNKFRHRTNKLVDAASAVAFAHENNNYNDFGDDSEGKIINKEDGI